MTKDQDPRDAMDAAQEESLERLVAVFKAAWHAANDRGDEGRRTRAGIEAVVEDLVLQSRETPPVDMGEAVSNALGDVYEEVRTSVARWGLQSDLPLGMGPGVLVLAHDLTTSVDLLDADSLAQQARRRTQARTAADVVSWSDVLLEEVFEAVAEDVPQRARAELLQVAAVAVKIVALLDGQFPAPVRHLLSKTGWTVCCRQPRSALPSTDLYVRTRAEVTCEGQA